MTFLLDVGKYELGMIGFLKPRSDPQSYLHIPLTSNVQSTTAYDLVSIAL
jgi:hypothetical protein